MAPRPDVSEARRKDILDAAARVFSHKGFGSARVDDIAEESGMSKGLLYWYFKGKDAVIAALMRRLFGPETSRVSSVLQGPAGARERILLLTEEIVRQIEVMSRFLPISFEYYSLAFRNRQVGQVLREFFREYTAGVQAVMEEGIRDGEFRSVDARQAALTYGAIVEGTIFLWMFDRETVDLEAQLREGASIFLRGIAGKPRRQRAGSSKEKR